MPPKNGLGSTSKSSPSSVLMRKARASLGEDLLKHSVPKLALSDRISYLVGIVSRPMNVSASTAQTQNARVRSVGFPVPTTTSAIQVWDVYPKLLTLTRPHVTLSRNKVINVKLPLIVQ